MRIPFGLGFGALLYGVIALGANPVLAAELTKQERAALKEMRSGDMTKLVFHREPRPEITESFRDKYGNEITIADFRGKVVVLNFWATWCPPCRAEMPSIDRLSGAMAGADLEVLALSTDRFEIERVEAFFEDIGVKNLAVLQDQTGAVPRRAGALGLPVTLILGRDGREIARLQGEAEWDSPEAKGILTRVIELTAPGA